LTKLHSTFLTLILLTGIALVSVLPLPFYLNSGLPAPQGFSTRIQDNDPAMFCWNLWWVQQWIAGQSPLMQCNMIHHPFGMSLNRHTLSVANGIIAAPITRYSGPVHAYNLLIIFHALLTTLGMYCLARELYISRLSALLAAMLFTWWPARLVHAGFHLNLASTGWMLLSLIWLIRSYKDFKWHRILLAAFFITLTGSSSWHLLQQLCLVIPFTLFLVHKVQTNIKTRVVHASAAITLGLIMLLPLIVPLIQTDPDIPVISIDETRQYSIQPKSLFIPAASNPLFKNVVSNYYSSVQGNVIENTGFIGVTVFLLIAAGLIVGPSRNRLLIGAGVLFILLSLGPDIRLLSWRVPLPFSVLSEIPLLNFSRTPGRFMIAAGLFLSISCAITLEHTGIAKKRVGGILFVLLIVEFLPGQMQIVKTGPLSESAFIASQNPTGILVVPNDWSNQYHMLAQTRHQHPITTGFSARLPQTVFHRMDGIPGLQGLSNPQTAFDNMLKLQPADWIRIRDLLNIDTVVFYSRFCSPPPTEASKYLADLNPQPVFSNTDAAAYPDLIIDLNRFDISLPQPEPFLLDRWSGPEDWGMGMDKIYWGLYPSARIRLLHTGTPVQISFKALAARQSGNDPVTTRIRHSNTDLYSFSSAPEDGWVFASFEFDSGVLSTQSGSSGTLPYIDLWFDFSSGTAPSHLSKTTEIPSDDMRLLALAIRDIRVQSTGSIENWTFPVGY
jgi:hypothetical protein